MLNTYLSIYLSIYLPIYLCISLSLYIYIQIKPDQDLRISRSPHGADAGHLFKQCRYGLWNQKPRTGTFLEPCLHFGYGCWPQLQEQGALPSWVLKEQITRPKASNKQECLTPTIIPGSLCRCAKFLMVLGLGALCYTLDAPIVGMTCKYKYVYVYILCVYYIYIYSVVSVPELFLGEGGLRSPSPAPGLGDLQQRGGGPQGGGSGIQSSFGLP